MSDIFSEQDYEFVLVFGINDLNDSTVYIMQQKDFNFDFRMEHNIIMSWDKRFLTMKEAEKSAREFTTDYICIV